MNTQQIVQTNSDVVILEGVKLAEEKKKGGSSLWSLADGDYQVQILSRRADFKGKDGSASKVAVVTNLGFTSIASLFEMADQDVVNDHTNSTTGDFQFSPNYWMTAKLANGRVVQLKKTASKN